MARYELGDGVNLEHLVYGRNGALVDATVALVVTRPDGGTITPAVTRTATGTYQAATFAADVAGEWSYRWQVTGVATDVAGGTFTVTDPAAAPAPVLYSTSSRSPGAMRVRA